jgi:hypothetical protein
MHDGQVDLLEDIVAAPDSANVSEDSGASNANVREPLKPDWSRCRVALLRLYKSISKSEYMTIEMAHAFDYAQDVLRDMGCDV